MKINNTIKISFALLLSCFCEMNAEVRLPVLISDGMVLQRDSKVKIWGTAGSGEKVNITFQKKKHSIQADEAGNWSTELSGLKTGGPYLMKINDKEIKDILVGDVWLCSGQSNMEFPVERVTEMFADEINSYENINIRQFKVPAVYDFTEEKDDLTPSSWKPLTKENVMSFSAIAYFYAKEMYEKTGIPVGIINSSWGGTPVESWISEEGLKEFPKYINDKKRFENQNYRNEIKKLESMAFERWNRALFEGDPGLSCEIPWYSDDCDDSQWKTVDLFSTHWGTNGLNANNGSHWFRKNITVSSEFDGKPATIKLGCVVDADSVFINGVFVGTTSYRYPPRIYDIPAGILKAGENNITVRLISNSGNPHFVREKPYKIICGEKEISLEGEWKYRYGASMPSAPDMMFFYYKPVCLYNAMIHPLRNYAVKGVLWYQGESNVSRRNEYEALLSSMIKDWRRSFADSGLPFYIIELADYLHPDDHHGRKAWAEFREVQAKVASGNSNTTLIKNSDLGEWNDIHPLDKKSVAKRIAYAVLNEK